MLRFFGGFFCGFFSILAPFFPRISVLGKADGIFWGGSHVCSRMDGWMGWMGWSQSTHFCLSSPCIRPLTAVRVSLHALAESKTGDKGFWHQLCLLLCAFVHMYVPVCISPQCVCMCVRAFPPSTQRPSQSPLAGRERVQRSNEGVISLAGRLLHY